MSDIRQLKDEYEHRLNQAKKASKMEINRLVSVHNKAWLLLYHRSVLLKCITVSAFNAFLNRFFFSLSKCTRERAVLHGILYINLPKPLPTGWQTLRIWTAQFRNKSVKIFYEKCYKQRLLVFFKTSNDQSIGTVLAEEHTFTQSDRMAFLLH